MRRPLVSGKPSIPKHVRYALAMFTVGIVVGVIVTYYVAGRMVADMHAGEVYEAVRRENRAFEYSLIGWVITVVVSSASTVAVWYRLYDRHAPRDGGKLGQTRIDES